MQATLWALDLETGETVWETKLGQILAFQSFYVVFTPTNPPTDMASQQFTLTLESWTFKFFVLIQITMETGASEEFSKMGTPLWQPDTLTASRAGVSSSTTRAAPWSGPSTWRET